MEQVENILQISDSGWWHWLKKVRTDVENSCSMCPTFNFLSGKNAFFYTITFYSILSRSESDGRRAFLRRNTFSRKSRWNIHGTELRCEIFQTDFQFLWDFC